MPIEALRAFSKKQVPPHQLVQALVAHDGWYVPMLWAMMVLRHSSFEDVVGEHRGSMGFETLRAFTSREAVTEVGEDGCYVGPIRGSELFEKLPVLLQMIEVNPGLDSAWTTRERSSLECVQEIAKGMALAHAIDRWAPGVRERLLSHVFWMYRSDTRAIPVYSRELPFGVVFTDRYSATVVADELAGWKLVRVDGSTLFAAVDALRVPGFVVNPWGHDGVNRVVPREMCQELAVLAETRDQVG